MDRAVIQHQLEMLPADEQDKVAAFLAALRMKRDGLIDEVQRRLDDSSPENWVSWKTAKVDLGLEGERADSEE